jgi:hypothetical protein
MMPGLWNPTVLRGGCVDGWRQHCGQVPAPPPAPAPHRRNGAPVRQCGAAGAPAGHHAPARAPTPCTIILQTAVLKREREGGLGPKTVDSIFLQKVRRQPSAIL